MTTTIRNAEDSAARRAARSTRSTRRVRDLDMSDVEADARRCEIEAELLCTWPADEITDEMREEMSRLM